MVMESIIRTPQLIKIKHKCIVDRAQGNMRKTPNKKNDVLFVIRQCFTKLQIISLYGNLKT